MRVVEQEIWTELTDGCNLDLPRRVVVAVVCVCACVTTMADETITTSPQGLLYPGCLVVYFASPQSLLRTGNEVVCECV